MSPSSTAQASSSRSVKPLVSIVISNYNYGRYLRAAIDSALAQTYPPIEVVVVDDGSTDDSREVIESYGARILPVFKSNGGQGSAINAGFAASRGEIVMFLDADDEFLTDAVDEVIKVWRPGVAKAQFQLELIDDCGKLLGRRVPHFEGFVPNGDIRDRIVRFGEYPTGTVERRCISAYRTSPATAAGRNDLVDCRRSSAEFPGALFRRRRIAARVAWPLIASIRAMICVPKGRHLEALHRRLTAVISYPRQFAVWRRLKGIKLDPRAPGFDFAGIEAQNRFDPP